MDVKYQIFVSSTYEDLKVERDYVMKAILEMGHIPVGMEMFSASDEDQWRTIQRQIDDSDYYVIISAHKYGSMDGNISYTEKEYDYATSKGVPTLGFIIHDSANWPIDRSENDHSKREKLNLFKDKIKKRLVNFWHNKEELNGKVTVALIKQFSNRPRTGWVKADKAAGPDVLNELSRLSKENAELRKKLASFESNENSNKKIEETIENLSKSNIGLDFFYEYGDKWENHKTVSLLRIFIAIAPALVSESSETEASISIALNFNPDNKKKLRYKYPIPSNVTESIFADLLINGLVELSKKKHPVTNVSVYWSLTKFGIETYKVLREKHFKFASEVEDIKKPKNKDKA